MWNVWVAAIVASTKSRLGGLWTIRACCDATMTLRCYPSDGCFGRPPLRGTQVFRSTPGTSAIIRESSPTVRSQTRCPVPDPVPANPPVEPTGVDEPAAPGSAKKVGARKATKRPTRPALKRGTREAASEPVKVGSDTIVMPKSLATNLTPKDLKKLRAVFKRVHKRGKKRTAKKRATKKR
jgi:hypothetical protein